jgi:hypothetical protein
MNRWVERIKRIVPRVFYFRIAHNFITVSVRKGVIWYCGSYRAIAVDWSEAELELNRAIKELIVMIITACLTILFHGQRQLIAYHRVQYSPFSKQQNSRQRTSKNFVRHPGMSLNFSSLKNLRQAAIRSRLNTLEATSSFEMNWFVTNLL